MPNRPYHAAHNDKAGHLVYSPGDTDQQLTTFSTHMLSGAQTPLVRFVVDMFYKQV